MWEAARPYVKRWVETFIATLVGGTGGVQTLEAANAADVSLPGGALLLAGAYVASIMTAWRWAATRPATDRYEDTSRFREPVDA